MSLVTEMGSVRALHGLGDAHLHKLAAIARPQEYPMGEVLFREGDNSTLIFILISGNVLLEVTMRDRGPTAIYAAGPGELLGWSPLLGRHAMTATARSKTPSRLAVLEVEQVRELIEKDAPFGVAFLRQLAMIVSDRLTATRQCLAAARDHELPRFSTLHEGSD